MLAFDKIFKDTFPLVANEPQSEMGQMQKQISHHLDVS